MAGAYLVTIPDSARAGAQFGGANAMVVYAEDATDAKEMCKAQYSGDGDAAWDAATATVIAAAADLEGWTVRIIVNDTDGANVLDLSYTNIASATVDSMGAALDDLINAASAAIADAAYTAGTNTLVVATGSGGSDLGDHTLIVTMTPPSGYSPCVALVGTITDEGDATDDLSVVFTADAFGKFYAAAKVVTE